MSGWTGREKLHLLALGGSGVTALVALVLMARGRSELWFVAAAMAFAALMQALALRASRRRR